MCLSPGSRGLPRAGCVSVVIAATRNGRCLATKSGLVDHGKGSVAIVPVQADKDDGS